MIKHKIFLAFTLAELLVLAGLVAAGRHGAAIRTAGEVRAKKELVRSLSLTDLSIWTEARYTRHPSQADFFTSFQDFPSSLEHFPAGSIMGPSMTGAPSGQARP